MLGFFTKLTYYCSYKCYYCYITPILFSQSPSFVHIKARCSQRHRKPFLWGVCKWDISTQKTLEETLEIVQLPLVTCRILTLKHRAAKISDVCAAPQGRGFLSFPKFFMWLLLHVYEDKVSKNTAQDSPEVCSENICKLKDLLPIRQA